MVLKAFRDAAVGAYEYRMLLAHAGQGLVQAVEWDEATATLVLEYLPGPTGAEFARSAPDIPSLSRFFLPAVSALAGMHARGTVATDVSLENIVGDGLGGSKLIDLEGSRPANSRNHGFAKPNYAPEEQRAGTSLQTSMDVYALAVTLYRAATPPTLGGRLRACLGGSAWSAPDAAGLAKLRARSPEIADIVARGLHTSPARRPSVREFQVVLARLATTSAAPRRRAGRVRLGLGIALLSFAVIGGLMLLQLL